MILGRSEDIFYIRNDYKYNIAVRPQKSENEINDVKIYYT